CGQPRRRIVRRTAKLDPKRPQARRAMEIAKAAGLSAEHIATVQATNVSDADKTLKVQSGTGRNSARVKELAAEAKQVLGGYFRKFTFARRETINWTTYPCLAKTAPGLVLNPFARTGTTFRVASMLSRSVIAIDLQPGL